METILKRIVIGGLFLMPFLALFVSSSLFFPFITGKNFAFRFIIEIVLFAWLGLCILKSEYRPKWNWLLGSIVIFTAIIFVADIFGANSYKSIWSNYERMEGFVTLAHLLAYFLVLVSMFTESLWQKFLNTWLVSSLLISIYGLFQIWGLAEIHQGGVRVDASFGNATYLAVFLLVTFFIVLYKFSRSESKNWKIALGILGALQLFILYHTATRGAILGLIVGLSITALYIGVFEKENKSARKAALASIAALIILVGGFLLVRNTGFVRNSPVLNRFASISFEEKTTKSRFLVWNMALQGFKENPILGYGQENFNYVFNKYYDPEMYGQEQWFDRTHNVVLDWLIAGGILGLLAYLSIFVFAFIYIFRSDWNTVTKGLFAGLLSAYFFQNLFVFDNLISYLIFFSMLGFIYSKSPARVFWTKEYSLQARNILQACLLAALLFSIYFVNGRGFLQGRAFIAALTPQAGKFENNLELFKDALAYDSFGTSEVREHLTETANSVRKSNAPAAIKSAFYELATSELNKQLEKTPNDARHHFFAGTLAANFGQHDVALAHYEMAHELSPRKQAMLFGLGGTYLAKNESEKAAPYFEEAYELAPSYNEARALYVMSLIYIGEIEKAKEVLETGEMILDQRILKAYYDTKNFNLALSYAKTIAENSPNDAQAHISLAALYVELGMRQQAIASLRRAIEIEPAFKDQGEYYIKEIQAGRNP